MFTRGPMIGRIACVISVLYVLLISPGLRAQSTTDGAITGTVTDASGGAVPNASVTVTNKGTNLAQGVATDESGYFRAAKLQPASYAVKVEAPGLAPFTAENVIVQIGSVTEVSAKLNVASARATVIVSAETPAINTASPEFAPTLDQTAISNLPI